MLLMQVGHAFAERRMLVAEAAGQLAPYVAPEIASSLLLSIVQQLAADAEASVRAAAASSLSVLIAYLPGLDKYSLVSAQADHMGCSMSELMETTCLAHACRRWAANACDTCQRCSMDCMWGCIVTRYMH